MHGVLTVRPFRSLGVLVATTAVPVLVVALVAPGVASASTPKAVKGSCTSLSGDAKQKTGPDEPTLRGCTPSPNADGSGTFQFLAGATSGSSMITWSNGATTTFSFKTKVLYYNEVKKGAIVINPKFRCPPDDLAEAILKGKVTGNGDLPSGDTGLTGAVKATVCVDGSENLTLLSGKFSL